MSRDTDRAIGESLTSETTRISAPSYMGELGLMIALWDTLVKTVTAVAVIVIAFRMKRPR